MEARRAGWHANTSRVLGCRTERALYLQNLISELVRSYTSINALFTPSDAWPSIAHNNMGGPPVVRPKQTGSEGGVLTTVLRTRSDGGGEGGPIHNLKVGVIDAG